MGSGSVRNFNNSINRAVSPGGKGGQAAPPPDPFEQAYGFGGGKGGSYTPPGYEQRIAGYEAQRNELDAQAAQNLALRQNYSSPYTNNFQQFTGNYSYQQPQYMPPPQQFYSQQQFSPQQQFFSPQQQYFSPYMNQFQMAGNQFYQQPYSYQPSGYQPFSQMGGRSQLFAQRGKGGFY